MRTFITAAAGLAVAATASAAFNFQITEIWMGQDGTDVTADWFEITNIGDMSWNQGVDGDLFYDDDSLDSSVADVISGVTSIGAGESVVVMVGGSSDASTFLSVWGAVLDLTGLQVGWTDGAGLGQGGDTVALWYGGPAGAPDTMASFPSVPAEFDGASYDLLLGAFSTVGNGSGAVATLLGGGDDSDVFAIASPGSIVPAPGAAGLFCLAGFAARRRR